MNESIFPSINQLNIKIDVDNDSVVLVVVVVVVIVVVGTNHHHNRRRLIIIAAIFPPLPLLYLNYELPRLNGTTPFFSCYLVHCWALRATTRFLPLSPATSPPASPAEASCSSESTTA